MSKLLLEDRRSSLLSKSKSGGNYTTQGRSNENRYKRRLKSKLASSVKHFNNINMDKFFKDDIIDVIVDVTGETNIYNVRVSFIGTLDELHNFVDKDKLDPDKVIDRRDIIRALTRAFNNSDVYYNCSCPDFKYRFKYWATKNGTLVGDPEYRPIDPAHHAPTEKALRAANYYDDKGSGCKHINLVLNDSSWLIKVASVIYNYISYMKDNNSRMYEKYIYPAIYQEPYPYEQLDMFDDTDKIDIKQDQMPSTSDEIDKANQAAREKGRFKKGNEYEFKKYKPDPDQFTLDDYGADEEETEI